VIFSLFLELVLNRFGFFCDVSLYFFRSQFFLRNGFSGNTVSIKSLAFIKQLVYGILPVQLRPVSLRTFAARFTF
jgi:hypothetical protein